MCGEVMAMDSRRSQDESCEAQSPLLFAYRFALVGPIRVERPIRFSKIFRGSLGKHPTNVRERHRHTLIRLSRKSH
jgi:hypothetical protein